MKIVVLRLEWPYFMAVVSRQPCDRHKINSDEQCVVQELPKELNLSKDELA